ncbi:DegT/DnrJ/EryC1/StrS family aminotransferase [Hydrogenophaga sp.]|uniref:DegT/DnrJ/EryC1/StrS family aminotransferase n=1 Tax=Hydrogenophaga sp. TaxID=1904254 RepID=UPI00260C52C6|nr:DegT/DnrJ/EryC1/StrS family aminotransferase [Hydrogenophaga sp.]MDM7950746.1 DegT/DnrJ/EryC1/StrS family aminotransferase [Hydrogenophaga sp.]
MTTLPVQEICLKSDGGRIVRYIENKPVNHSTIQRLLSLSAEANQWSNFGPVSRLLEEKLEEVLGVPGELRVIACSNATVALHTLVAMHQHLQGRPLRWISSSFGFYSSIDGILQSAAISDCDQNGMLERSSLDPEAFDGMVITNIFGNFQDLSHYHEYAKKHRKIVLIDGAMNFQSGGRMANECISLHHTKPWGFGEGGCAIVEREHSELFRDMLAFGHHSSDAPINRLASNGKISDIASAYLLMRLEDLQKFRNEYQFQFRRIARIGGQLGLSILSGDGPHPGIPANVPILFPGPVNLPLNSKIPVRKYYFPLANTPIAVDIYRRIVNIPCHSEMARFSDLEIQDLLINLLAQFSPVPT